MVPITGSSDFPPPTYEEAIEPPSYEDVQTGKSSTVPTPSVHQFWGEPV